eukprot:jgi/Tetstr1/457114/TSEL_043764.t1
MGTCRNGDCVQLVLYKDGASQDYCATCADDQTSKEIARRLEEQSFNDSDPDWQILLRTCLRSKNATPGLCCGMEEISNVRTLPVESLGEHVQKLFWLKREAGRRKMGDGAPGYWRGNGRGERRGDVIKFYFTLKKDLSTGSPSLGWALWQYALRREGATGATKADTAGDWAIGWLRRSETSSEESRPQKRSRVKDCEDEGPEVAAQPAV